MLLNFSSKNIIFDTNRTEMNPERNIKNDTLATSPLEIKIFGKISEKD